MIKYTEEVMFVKKKLKNLIPIFIGAILGVCAGFLGADFFADSYSGKDLAMIFVAIVAVYYIHVIIHEAGHLVFGLLSGYQFVSFRIGSLTLYKAQGQWKWGRYKLAGTGGQCLMAPPELVNGSIPYRLFNLGGSLMNLIFVLPVFVLVLSGNLDRYLKMFGLMWCLVGMIAAAMNGIPMSVGAVDNDGKNALNLGKDPKALYSFWLQLKINQMQMEGKTILEMPESWFVRPSEEEMSNPMTAVRAALHCNYLMELKSYSETSKVIGEVLREATGLLPVHAMLLRVDQIFCEIMSDRNEVVLKYMEDKGLQKFMKAMQNYPAVIRTEYAYALCIQEDEKKAKRLKDRFEKVMKYHPNQAEIRTEIGFISDIENTELS